MPLYEYRCRSCGNVSEFLMHDHKMSKALECSSCGSMDLEKIFSVPGLLKNEAREKGKTCCGREERCDTPPCSGGGCRRN